MSKIHHHRTELPGGLVRTSCGTVVPSKSAKLTEDLAVLKPVHRCKRCWSAVSSPGRASLLARIKALCEANPMTPLAGLILSEIEG